MALVVHFSGSIKEYEQGIGFAAWVVAARPVVCSHCGEAHACILWSSYSRWVRTSTERHQIRIQRVRCTLCLVTDALLPSFVHMFRHYALPLIQQTILLALEQGLWGRALVDAIGPYGHPAPATIREWVWCFVLSAEVWLVVWLQCTLLSVDPQASLDLGCPPAYLQAITNHKRRVIFFLGWQAIRLSERLYAAVRARKLGLVFQAASLFAFLAAVRQADHFPPRVMWPVAPARPP